MRRSNVPQTGALWYVPILKVPFYRMEWQSKTAFYPLLRL